LQSNAYATANVPVVFRGCRIPSFSLSDKLVLRLLERENVGNQIAKEKETVDWRIFRGIYKYYLLL